MRQRRDKWEGHYLGLTVRMTETERHRARECQQAQDGSQCEPVIQARWGRPKDVSTAILSVPVCSWASTGVDAQTGVTAILSTYTHRLEPVTGKSKETV